MVFDAVAYREQLKSIPECLANPNFIEKAGWAKEDTGQILVFQSTGDNLVAITIGKVSPFHLLCSPIGNFWLELKVQSDFSKAKFQLTLDAPDEQVFVPVYRAGISTLIRLQKSTSGTGDKRNLLQGEDDFASICLAAKIFEK